MGVGLLQAVHDDGGDHDEDLGELEAVPERGKVAGGAKLRKVKMP